MKSWMDKIKQGWSSMKDSLAELCKKLKMDKWVRKLDRYIIFKFLGTYFFAIALIISIAVVFDINENMLTEIEIGQEDYDVVCPSEYIIERMLRKNLLQPINKDYGPNTPNWLGNVSKFAEDKFQQMGDGKVNVSDYAVGFMWGTTGILYNTKLVKEEEVRSWNVIFNPRFEGKILMKDAFRDIYSVMVCLANYDDIKAGKVTRDKLVAEVTDENITRVEDVMFRAKKQIGSQERLGLIWVIKQNGRLLN